MTDTPKIHEDLLRRAERIVKFSEQIDELREDLKLELTAAKGAGYDLKALRRVIKELRMSTDEREDQLTFDLVVDSYRAGVDLVTAAEMAGRPKPEFVPPEPPPVRESSKPAREQELYEAPKMDYETRKAREKAVAKAKADKYIKEPAEAAS